MIKEITGLLLALAGFVGLEIIGYVLAGWPFPAISGCILLMVYGAMLATTTGNGGAERSGNGTEDDAAMVVRGIDVDDPDGMIPGRS